MKRLFAILSVLAFLSVSTAVFAAAPKCIDVETASAKQLEGLDGIAASKAKAVIDYRKKMRTAATKAGKKTWNFKNWATLLKVPGLGPSTCQKNVTKVCFSGKVQKTCPKK